MNCSDESFINSPYLYLMKYMYRYVLSNDLTLLYTDA